MKTKIKLKVGQHKSLILLFLFTVFWQNQTFAQSSGIMFFWDSEVGCQEYFNGEDPRGTKEPVFIEQITDGVCIRVCEQSEVIYTLSGNLGATPNTQWTVVGGTIINQTDTTCKVKWGDVGYGSIGFTITTPTETITKTLCIEKIIIPKAEFSILSASDGFEGIGTYYACANQTIYFDNLSTTNSGSTIVSYLWDFRDGTFSSEFEPNHVYAHDGTYKVRLTVYNSCGCYSVFRMDIAIKSEGFDLVCPGVVCEDQTASYSLPFDGKELCQSVTQDHWSVLGGEIIDTNPDGEVTVLWNHVDQSGFGLLTFTPLNCDLNCLLPSTLKIPVIQKEGTIVGSSTLCINEQGRYSLPQWPTTDFHWQIFGNESGNLAEVLLTDQRNEVIIKPFGTGNLVLRCDYQNTLLHCGGFAEFIINVQNAITIEGSNAVCIGSTTEYTTNSGNPVNWILKNSNDIVVDTLNDSIAYSHVFTSAGNYSLTVESSSSCPTIPLSINVMAQPIAPTINGIDVICPDSPYIYNVINPDPNSIYHWNIINGTALTSLTGNQITVNFSNDTTHGVNVYRETITPSSCVSATVTKTISNVTIPADIQGNVTVCANNNSSYQAIVASSNPVSLYEDGDTYTWSLSNPSLGSITSGQGTNNINVLWNNVSVPTTTTLQVEIRKCTVTTTFNIDVTITPALELNLTGTESMCSGNYATFSVSTNGFTLPPGALFQWNFGDGSTLTTSSTNVTHQYYTSVTNNVIRQVTVKYLTPICNNTLSVSNTLLLTILPGPGAVASISEGGNNYCTVASIGAILTVATTPGATIEWYQNNTALGVSTNDYAVTAFGNYYFIATLNGCSTRSNAVSIYQNCQPIETCTPDPIPQVTNDSYNDCGDLILAGTTTVTPITIPVFDIFGPIQVTNYTDSVLEDVEPNNEIMKEKELYWIKKLETTDREKGYNIRMDSATSIIVSDETRKKLSAAQKKRFSDPKERERLSKAVKEGWKCDEGRKQRMIKKLQITNSRHIFHQYDKKGNFIKTYNTISDVMEENPSLRKQNIYQV
ncbi:MAG: PKD domain-containing protein, partial [Bacteroidia bacterium]